MQKIKKKNLTGNEQYKSVIITVPKKIVNKYKLDTLYETDRLHTQAVNEWIDKWYPRFDMIEHILTGRATTAMQDDSIKTALPTAYIQIAGNKMLDIMREHYLAVQNKIASDIWKQKELPAEYKFIYSTFARNYTLFHRFVNGGFSVDDVLLKWDETDKEYLQKVINCYSKLSYQQQLNIPIEIHKAFYDIRDKWNKPIFKGGSIQLDYRVYSLEDAKNTEAFNLWAKITTTTSYRRIFIPFMLLNWKRETLEQFYPDWKNSNKRKALLIIRGRHIHISVPITKEESQKPGKSAVYIGCDVGMTTPINLDNGRQYGKSFEELVKKDYDEYLRLQSIRNKIRTLKEHTEKRLQITVKQEIVKKLKRKISEYERHLSDHRWAELRRKIKATVKTEIGRSVNQLIKDMPFVSNTVLILEDLSEMSAKGTKRTRRGRFDLSVWTRGELQKHIQEDLEWLLAWVKYVVPEYTSQMCSKCGYVDRENRYGKLFCCKKCGHTEDADINAAKNIRERFFDTELLELAKQYNWNKDLRREKIKELLVKRANQAA